MKNNNNHKNDEKKGKQDTKKMVDKSLSDGTIDRKENKDDK
ncbi:hypothetical protein [Heyndrickxia acidiproducens]|nr:hypothetical protein [Heyndrickxia acidiproducens]